METRLYEVQHTADGTILAIGEVNPEYGTYENTERVTYVNEIPEGEDILHTYKTQNGAFISIMNEKEVNE